jgi:hypothetical protein
MTDRIKREDRAVRAKLLVPLVTMAVAVVVFGTVGGGELVVTPNPLRAVPSVELIEWHDWLDDGGFEQGADSIVVMDHPVSSLSPATFVRTGAAARTGTHGIRIETAAREGMLLGLKSGIEKGETTRCTFWARSLGGATDLRVSVLGVEGSAATDPVGLHQPDGPFRINEQWTQVQFTFDNTRGVKYGLLAIDIGPSMRIDIDDARIEAEQWKMAPATEATRLVGGISVPVEPVAPIRFNVLIHIEDPRLITQNEGYFWQKTAVFTELARTLHDHAGFLTIQPEEDWPTATLEFAPDTLSHLAERYGVVYSTHTHGPACIDASGRLRSNQDCNDCRTCSDWTRIETDIDPYTPEYIGHLRDLISQISGTSVSDHNGNFHYENAPALADVGISTWSAYKNHNTQATFDALFTNPWRPSECDAIETPETFWVHDPSSPIIFVPGWGQAVTRYPERIHTRLAAMLSQVILHADPDRVNTFYIVTHVDHYSAETGEPYIDYDPVTGRLTYGEAFTRDLGYWEETLTVLIDPLVAEGYLTWTSLPEIAELFLNWETRQKR